MNKLYALTVFCLFVFAAQSSAQTTHSVEMVSEMSAFQFEPENITIEEGDTIVWTNTTSVNHTSTSGTNCEMDGTWNSGNVASGQSFSRVFENAGEYPYYCIPHCVVGMTGSVTVDQAMAAGDVIAGDGSVRILPNPAEKKARIEVRKKGLSDVSIAVFDLTGKQVSVPTEKIGDAQSGVSFDLQTGALIKGIYFVRLKSEGNIQTTRRLIVQ